jgi:hypothetical protein
MANILEKLSGSLNANQPTKTNELGKIRSFSDNLESIPKSREYPEHLIANGRILHEGKPVSGVRTAICKRGDDVEFSTNVGQLPNNPLGGAIKDRLSRRLDGKFVTFENQDEPNKVDLVYATRKPHDWLNRERFNRELENHAKTKDLVSPVLSAATNIGQPRRNLNYSSLTDMANDIVDSNLGLQQRIGNRLVSGQYLPDGTNRRR